MKGHIRLLIQCADYLDMNTDAEHEQESYLPAGLVLGVATPWNSCRLHAFVNHDPAVDACGRGLLGMRIPGFQ